MKIGVISDTHVRTIDGVASVILKALEAVDLVVHAGDFTEKAVLDGLQSIRPIKAVCGNMDSYELRKALPHTELFTVGGKKIGLAHGSGGPWRMAERVRELFTSADIVIFGHSHEPCNRCVRGTLLFNPGPARDSFGLIIGDYTIIVTPAHL